VKVSQNYNLAHPKGWWRTYLIVLRSIGQAVDPSKKLSEAPREL